MSRTERVAELWRCTYGSKSSMNLAGKIVLSPIGLPGVLFVTVLEFLFSKDDAE